MGTEYLYVCRKCGYEVRAAYGCGFTWGEYAADPAKFVRGFKSSFEPADYAKIQSIFSAGKQVALLDYSRNFFRCPQCNRVRNGVSFEIIIPDIPEKIIRERLGCMCGGLWMPVDEEPDPETGKLASLRCPKCGDYMDGELSALWD